MRVQYASDVRRDILAGELWTDDDQLAAEIYETDGRWVLNLYAATVEPDDFIRSVQEAIAWLSAPRRSD
jgi:hypothetical protein